MSSPRNAPRNFEKGATQDSGIQSSTSSQMPVCSWIAWATSDMVMRLASSSLRVMRPVKATGWKLMALTTSMLSRAKRMMSPI